jgi:hypothetical protein
MSNDEKFDVIYTVFHYDDVDEKKISNQYIDLICDKTKINKDILTYYIKNNGNVEAIIEGFHIIIDEKDYHYKLLISKNMKIKENINKNLLYNLSHYCVLNNINRLESLRNNYEITHLFIKRELLNKKITIENSYKIKNVSNIHVSFRLADVIPDNCDYSLLEDEYQQELYYDVCNDLLNLRQVDIGHNYVIKFDIKFTHCLNSNMLLIHKWINNVYSEYIEILNSLKKHNEKYFTKQLIQNKINNFT